MYAGVGTIAILMSAAAGPRTVGGGVLPWEEGADGSAQLARALQSAPAIHPRVLYTLDDLPRLKEKVARSPQAAAYWQRLADSAANGQAEPMVLGFLYRMTGEEPYAAQAKEKLLALVRDPDWGQPGMDWAELYWAAPLAMRFGMAYDQIYDRLSPEERQEVRRTVVDRVVGPIMELARAGEGYYGWPRGNIGAHNMTHAGAAALAFVDEAPELAEGIACLAQRLVAWLDEGGIDGGWGEGVPYWQNWFIPAVRFADGLRRVAGREFDLFRHPFWSRSAFFPIYMAMPGQVSLFANFGDHFGTQIIAGPTLRKLAAEYRNPYAQWFADRLDATGSYQTPLMSFLWYDPEVPARPPDDLPPSKVFRGIDWAAMRSGLTADDDLFLAFKGGQSDWDHHHPDLGSFILNAFGERLIIDQGYAWRDEQGFSYAYSTAAHNVVLVDGQGQVETGVGARGPWEVAAEITDFLHSPVCDLLSADISQAYLPMALHRFTRCVLFIRPDYFVLLDDVEAPRPARWAWLWHTFGRVIAADDGAADRLLIHGGREGKPWAAGLGVRFVGAGPLSYTLSTHSMAGSRDPLISPYTDTCIRLEPQEKARRQQLLTVLWPVHRLGGVGEAASVNGSREGREDAEVFTRLAAISPAAGGDALGARIPKGEKVDTILFQPEGKSAAASAVETDSRLCWLREQAATGRVEAFALLDGTFLAVAGARLIESAGGQRFTAAVGLAGGGWWATVQLGTQAELFLRADPPPAEVRVDDGTVPGSYDPDRRGIRLVLPAGEHQVYCQRAHSFIHGRKSTHHVGCDLYHWAQHAPVGAVHRLAPRTSR